MSWLHLLLSGASGARKSVLYTDQLDAPRRLRWATALGWRRVACTLRRTCAAATSAAVTTPFKLYAVDAAGVGMDYPRARMLGQTPTAQTTRSYVALGDSFSAGEGVEPFIPPSDTNGYHRSELAYAKLLDEAPGLNLDLQEFVACSGAETTHVINGKEGEDPQLNALNEDVDVVTITIGGNDIGFKQFATACFNPATHCDDSGPYQGAMDKLQNNLPGDLDVLFASIAAQVGVQTRILVMGYPRMMPHGMDEFPNCWYLSSEERLAIADVKNGLNDALSSAVDRAGMQFEFVDADVNLYGVRISPFAGHELCGENAYFHGISVPNTGYSFHPNQNGQAAYAELVSEYLVTHP